MCVLKSWWLFIILAQTKNLEDTKNKMDELLKENQGILSLTNLTYKTAYQKMSTLLIYHKCFL